MELTYEHFKAIREAARTVEYGSITVHISETSKHLDLEIHRRVRIESGDEHKKISGPFKGVNDRGCP